MSSFYRIHPRSRCSLSTGFARKRSAACFTERDEESGFSFVIRRDATSCATAKILPSASPQEGGCSRRLERFLPGTGGKDLIQFAFGRCLLLFQTKIAIFVVKPHLFKQLIKKKALSIKYLPFEGMFGAGGCIRWRHILSISIIFQQSYGHGQAGQKEAVHSAIQTLKTQANRTARSQNHQRGQTAKAARQAGLSNHQRNRRRRRSLRRPPLRRRIGRGAGERREVQQE